MAKGKRRGKYPTRQDARKKMAKAAAEMIAARLFVNGQGTKADRLVLTSKDGRDLGGWCERSVADQAEQIVAEALKLCDDSVFAAVVGALDQVRALIA